MPKSIPTNGQANWGTALNSHLGQLMDPTYGGFNLWNNTTRPWQDGDTSKAEFINKTGYNTELEIFETWVSGPSAEDCYWKTMKPAGKSNGFKQIPGTFRSSYIGDYNVQKQQGKLFAEGGANFNLVNVGDVIKTTPSGALFPFTGVVTAKNSNTEITLKAPVIKYFQADETPWFNTGKTITSGAAGATSIVCSGDMSSTFAVGDVIAVGFSFGSGEVNGKRIDNYARVTGVNGSTLIIESPFKDYDSSTGTFSGTLPTTGYPVWMTKTANSGLSLTVNKEIFSASDENNNKILSVNNNETSLLGSLDVLSRSTQTYNGINVTSDGWGSYLNLFSVNNNSLNTPGQTIGGKTYSALAMFRQFGNTCVLNSNTSLNISSGNILTLGAKVTTQIVGVGGITVNTATSPADVKVGIGINAPSAKLHVNGNIIVSGDSFGGHIQIANNGKTGVGLTTKYVFYNMAASDAGGLGQNCFCIHAYKSTTSSVPFTILDNDNVGISTYAPSQKLHVAGNILATGTVTQNSDITLKKDIVKIDGALNKLSQIKGVTYKWKKPENHGDDETEQLGIIAQDVEKVFPQAVSTDPNGIKSVSYGDMVAPLIEAVKELTARVKELEAKVK